MGRVQPPAVNAAGKRVCRVCRPLAGAEMQKPRTMARLECCVVAGIEPALRFSISIMPALPANRLMPYSTHLTRKRELSYTTTVRALHYSTAIRQIRFLRPARYCSRSRAVYDPALAILLPVVIKKPAQRRALIDWSCDKRKYHIMGIKLVHFRQTVNTLLLT